MRRLFVFYNALDKQGMYCASNMVIDNPPRMEGIEQLCSIQNAIQEKCDYLPGQVRVQFWQWMDEITDSTEQEGK